MKTIDYAAFNEQLFVEKLANGLTVYVQPKSGFQKAIATLGVNYGSIDTQFTVDGKLFEQPAGIAHFIEHKMFDKKDYDVFELFNRTGAAANAYTSFTKTNYLFSTTEDLKANLDILLDFVQIPYFTKEKVEREKGIIDQEINMYLNDPDNRLYFQTIHDLYPNSPLAEDIAGTVASVDQITLPDIEQAYQLFYRPENMTLFITGKVVPEQAIAWVKENQQQKSFPKGPTAKRMLRLPPIDHNDIHFHQMAISRPKAAIGIRGNDVCPHGRDGLAYEIAISLVMDLFFSETAEDYTRLYQEGVLDDSFSWEFENERGFHFALLSGDTNQPEEFINQILTIMHQIPERLPEMHSAFALQKKELLGNYIEMMDSEEAISGQFDGFTEAPSTIYDEVAVLNSLTLQQALAFVTDYLETASIQPEIIQENR
ncbi:EF-P 5-aminopentanol modification-associated protein YfmH [Lentilactobacillus farraginis]|uniref:M16C subfamily protease n=1 Tax=Lentilactobacillus farraginis DSM 18382 = JCM 14108 TaxID=1423743 RepID=X0P975_9LACO|nr:pitrilysin family protein [Lentilactobacillus farraginis]KRM10067.1 M16C subfamily protease [Lentilactobacillus farraginis DSM 18382 = JCM 14108]GAF35223.1 peptidase [Lentilactobacillus farraginis DSM 18382 = JCM 14108]